MGSGLLYGDSGHAHCIGAWDLLRLLQGEASPSLYYVLLSPVRTIAYHPELQEGSGWVMGQGILSVARLWAHGSGLLHWGCGHAHTYAHGASKSASCRGHR